MRPAPRPALRRPLAVGVCATLAVGPALLLPAGAALAAETAASNNPVCAFGTLPGPQGDVTSTDSGVAVYVGGDYVARQRAAESEGRLVVAGTTTVDAGLLNLGRVGVGSGVVPVPGDVLVSVGDVTVAPGSRLDVNHGVPGGGDVRTGGDLRGEIELNGGASVTRSADAGTVAASAGSTLDSVSAALFDLAPTGRLDTSGAYPTLVGDGDSDPQVFSITTAEAADLDTLVLTQVGDAAVVVNVRGDDGRLDTVHTAAGTVDHRIDDGAELGTWAPRIVWNFGRAETLELAGGSQLVGSILAPRADVQQGAHTNGRLWVGGDLVLGTGGSGIEHHNYPWTGECTDLPATTPPSGTTEDGDEDGEATPEPTTAPSTPGDGPSAPATPAAAETPAAGEADGDGDRAPVTAGPTDDDLIAAAAAAGAATPSTPADSSTAADELPRTGAQTGVVMAVAAVLLGGGAALLALRRRTARRVL